MSHKYAYAGAIPLGSPPLWYTIALPVLSPKQSIASTNTTVSIFNGCKGSLTVILDWLAWQPLWSIISNKYTPEGTSCNVSLLERPKLWWITPPKEVDHVYVYGGKPPPASPTI